MHTALITSPQTLVDIVKARQAVLELSDHDLCVAVGLERAIALGLIKSGSMRMPLTKIPALATALALDPAELLKLALSEQSPDLLQVIEEAFNPMCLTATETNLIRHLRELAGNAVSAPIVFPGNGIIALVAV
jgi:hypothetical protein